MDRNSTTVLRTLFTSRVRWGFFSLKNEDEKKPSTAVTQIVLFIYLFVYQKTIYWISNNAVGVGGWGGNWESWRDSINLWLYSEAELFPKDSSNTSCTISWTTHLLDNDSTSHPDDPQGEIQGKQEKTWMGWQHTLFSRHYTFESSQFW